MMWMIMMKYDHNDYDGDAGDDKYDENDNELDEDEKK